MVGQGSRHRTQDRPLVGLRVKLLYAVGRDGQGIVFVPHGPLTTDDVDLLVGDRHGVELPRVAICVLHLGYCVHLPFVRTVNLVPRKTLKILSVIQFSSNTTFLTLGPVGSFLIFMP